MLLELLFSLFTRSFKVGQYVSYKDLKEVTSDLKKIYTANTDEIAHFELKSFASKWDGKYPVISDIWQRNWSGIIPFFAFPAEIRYPSWYEMH